MKHDNVCVCVCVCVCGGGGLFTGGPPVTMIAIVQLESQRGFGEEECAGSHLEDMSVVVMH